MGASKRVSSGRRGPIHNCARAGDVTICTRCGAARRRSARSGFHGVECLGELAFHAFAQGRQPYAFGMALEQGRAVFVLQGLDQGGDGPGVTFSSSAARAKPPRRADASKARKALSCSECRVGVSRYTVSGLFFLGLLFQKSDVVANCRAH